MSFIFMAAHASAAMFIASLFAAAVAAGGGKSMFEDKTYDKLVALPASDRMIAAVRCEDTELVSRGSRRERVLIKVHILAATDDVKYEAPLRLMRYTQGDMLMKRGESYIIVAHRGNWLPAWNLLDYKPVNHSDAGAALRAALGELTTRLDRKKP